MRRLALIAILLPPLLGLGCFTQHPRAPEDESAEILFDAAVEDPEEVTETPASSESIPCSGRRRRGGSGESDCPEGYTCRRVRRAGGVCVRLLGGGGEPFEI